MQVIDRISALQKQLSAWRDARRRIALVPTMGNLHAGHLSLVTKAKQVADRVVATIFVNPTQFVPGEDYETYPRTLDRDREQLNEAGTDLLFCPPVEAVYPGAMTQQTRIVVPALDNIFCGRSRPGHFSGVATVVVKLLNVVQPDVAIFGEKDYQQLLLIKQLVRDLFIPVEILGMPTVRETDGLALSSRNSYLSQAERKIAPLLYQTLRQSMEKIRAGHNDFSGLETEAAQRLDQAGFKTEYVAVRDAATLGEPENGDLVILVAAHLGRARLIDNLVIRR